MPGRNILKLDVAGSYNHVYTRGVNKQAIFLQHDDYTVFMNLCKRYLSKDAAKNFNGLKYPHFYGKLELICFCLMPNHIHMLLYQNEAGAMQHFMHAVMTSYGAYFNKVHKRRGPLFESRYKASIIFNDTYLQHITRYIHLNPSGWDTYPFSSLPFYLGRYSAEWLRPQRIMLFFKSPYDYVIFVKDYEANKQMLEIIKKSLANT